MTLFYLQLDRTNHHLSWVRAGHDPAVFYDPSTDRFEELSGKGIALGIDENWRYTEETRRGLTPGQIILMSTDGIWEARNPQDDLFGKQAICSVVRQNSHARAAEIQAAILAEIKRFQQGVEPADDIALVVIKISNEV